MNRPLFYYYGALLLALGVIEVATIEEVYDVEKLEQLDCNIRRNAGFLAFFRATDCFQYFPNSERCSAQIKRHLMGAVENSDQGLEHVVSFINCCRRAALVTIEIFVRDVEYYKISSDETDKRIIIRYDDKDVAITFTNDTGYDGVKQVLDKAEKKCYGIDDVIPPNEGTV